MKSSQSHNRPLKQIHVRFQQRDYLNNAIHSEKEKAYEIINILASIQLNILNIEGL